MCKHAMQECAGGQELEGQLELNHQEVSRISTKIEWQQEDHLVVSLVWCDKRIVAPRQQAEQSWVVEFTTADVESGAQYHSGDFASHATCPPPPPQAAAAVVVSNISSTSAICQQYISSTPAVHQQM
jgi:hypothetical protein